MYCMEMNGDPLYIQSYNINTKLWIPSCTYVIDVCSNMLCIRFFQHDSNRHKTFGLKHQGQRMATLDRPYPCAMLSAALIVCVVFPVAGKFTPDAGLKPGGSPRTSIWNVKQCETDLLCHIKQGSAINPWGVINLNPGLTAIWWFEPSNHHSSRAELCAQSSPHKAQLRSISKGLDRSLGLQILSAYGSNK
jgi:hypothetical protein